MEFYGSRYAPKRYKCEPIVVSTEYYDYTLDNDADSGGGGGGGAGGNYRVMPITYDECTPAYNNCNDDCYNIQHYGSNVVLPFSACIEIYNNKPRQGVGAAPVSNPPYYDNHIPSSHHHAHHHHHYHHPGQNPTLTQHLPSRIPDGHVTPQIATNSSGEYSSGGEDEIIINVRHVPAQCSCGRSMPSYQPAIGGHIPPPSHPPPPPPPSQPVQYRVIDRPARYDYRDQPPVKYFRLDYHSTF